MLLTEPKNLWMIFTADSDSVCEGSNPSPAATLSGCNGKPLHPLFLGCRKNLRVFSRGFFDTLKNPVLKKHRIFER